MMAIGVWKTGSKKTDVGNHGEIADKKGRQGKEQLQKKRKHDKCGEKECAGKLCQWLGTCQNHI